MDYGLNHLDRVLKALADPTRLRIVGLLRSGEICVCHIHDALKISQPKTSRHLAYLRRAGVVSGEKRGLWVYYRLVAQDDRVAQAALDAVGHCAGHLPSIAKDAGRLQKAKGPGSPKPAGEGGCPPSSGAATMACCE